MTAVTRAVAEATSARSLATELPAGRTTGWWGMVLFVATEGALFAALFGSYFYLRFQAAPQWSPPGIGPPELLRPLIMTALLLPSSLPAAWAERGIRRGRRWRLRLGLAGTLLLGSGFLVVQGIEYATKLAELTWTGSAYGSVYYTTTGLHGIHVAVGLLLVAGVLAASLRGSFGPRRYERVRLVAIYWHFANAVWLPTLFTLYLSEHL